MFLFLQQTLWRHWTLRANFDGIWWRLWPKDANWWRFRLRTPPSYSSQVKSWSGTQSIYSSRSLADAYGLLLPTASTCHRCCCLPLLLPADMQAHANDHHKYLWSCLKTLSHLKPHLPVSPADRIQRCRHRREARLRTRGRRDAGYGFISPSKMTCSLRILRIKSRTVVQYIFYFSDTPLIR